MSRKCQRGRDGGGHRGGARISREAAADDVRLRQANYSREGAVVEAGGRKFVNDQIDAETHGGVLIALSRSARCLQQEHAAHRLSPGRASILSQRSRDGVSSLAMSHAGTLTSARSHPPGLYVLFFTELWERYSFYSMM